MVNPPSQTSLRIFRNWSVGVLAGRLIKKEYDRLSSSLGVSISITRRDFLSEMIRWRGWRRSQKVEVGTRSRRRFLVFSGSTWVSGKPPRTNENPRPFRVMTVQLGVEERDFSRGSLMWRLKARTRIFPRLARRFTHSLRVWDFPLPATASTARLWEFSGSSTSR